MTGRSRSNRTSAVPHRAGPYRFIAELGKSGMGEVYLVITQTAGAAEQLHVLKRPKVDYADDERFVAMFLDEGKLAARLSHPNIVQTTEVAQFDGHYYIAMEYVEGQPLNRLLHARHNGDLSLKREDWLHIVRAVLNGLRYAHNLTDYDGSPLDIVHRDVSPGNVLVTYAGDVKLVDFGIAKATLQSSRTGVGIIKGKAKYMPPEQIGGGRVDHRADLFALGVVMFELVTGRPPLGTARPGERAASTDAQRDCRRART